MSAQHPELAAGRWGQMSLIEQMANIGSEVERTLNWKAQSNIPYSQKAFERALELFDLTLGDGRNLTRLKEIARAREVFADFFLGAGLFVSTEASWKKYFLQFAVAARRGK
jgi:hypothetical protein